MARVLVDSLAPWLSTASAYHEPFVGGGAVALEVARRFRELPISVNDLNAGVVEVWRHLADGDLEGILTTLSTWTPTVDLFIEIRDHSEGDIAYLAARSIFLSKTSFSGIGVTPIGRYDQSNKKYPIGFKWKLDSIEKTLRDTSTLLKGRLTVTQSLAWEILPSDARAVMYLDPPYYQAGPKIYVHSMLPEEHVKLSEGLRSYDRWILSYDDCPFVRDLYAWADIREFGVWYSMAGGRSAGQLPRGEVLVRPRTVEGRRDLTSRAGRSILPSWTPAQHATTGTPGTTRPPGRRSRPARSADASIQQATNAATGSAASAVRSADRTTPPGRQPEMAKLSTPYHTCATIVVRASDLLPIGHCPHAAYKRLDGSWYCQGCLRRAKARRSTEK